MLTHICVRVCVRVLNGQSLSSLFVPVLCGEGEVLVKSNRGGETLNYPMLV